MTKSPNQSTPFGDIVTPPDNSTQQLQEIERRIPVVGDKALVNLVNGIQINKDIIHYRKSRGFLGQLFDCYSGSDRDRQLLLDGNLIAGQETLHNWILELSDSLCISQVALEMTQRSLLEARHAIRHQKSILQDQQKAVESLLRQLNQTAQKVNLKFRELDRRIHNLEVRVAANEDLDRILTAWAAEQTYTLLPWPIQAILLAREVFSSAVATYELETHDTSRYRTLLTNKILASRPDIPRNFFGTADLLEFAWQEVEKRDLALIAALLEVRSIPQSRLSNTPILFAMGTTLELATLPSDSQPTKPGQCAVELCRATMSNISRTTDARELINAVVQETANDCLTVMAQR
jgi:hypothetical protein